MWRRLIHGLNDGACLPLQLNVFNLECQQLRYLSIPLQPLLHGTGLKDVILAVDSQRRDPGLGGTLHRAYPCLLDNLVGGHEQVSQP